MTTPRKPARKVTKVVTMCPCGKARGLHGRRDEECFDCKDRLCLACCSRAPLASPVRAMSDERPEIKKPDATKVFLDALAFFEGLTDEERHRIIRALAVFFQVPR